MKLLFNLDETERILFVNDIHIARERLHDFQLNWGEAIDICKKRKIKYIVVGGDLFEARHSQSLAVLTTIMSAIEASFRFGIHVVLANGNHDKVNQEDEVGYCHIFKHHPNVIVVDDWRYIQTPESNIFILAYFPETGSLPDKLRDIENSDVFNNGKRNILYAHAGVMGGLETENKKEASKEEFSAFDVVYMGHYHDRKHISGSNIYYIGSSRQYNYGEDTEKGYNICNSLGELEFIANKVNSKYVTVPVNFKDLDNAESIVNEVKLEHGGGCLIKFKISVDSKNKGNVDKQFLLDAGVNRIEIENVVEQKESVNSSFYKRYNKEQIVDTYSEYCNNINVSDKLGIKYING